MGNTSLVVWLAGGVLAGLLAAAAIFDFARRRIPNLLVGSGLALGLALNTLLPEGFGLFNRHGPGGLGLLAALGGVLVAGGLLLPLYLLGAMGAGDVKLMAMVGAFLSPAQAFWAVLVVLVTGGALSLVFALRNSVLPKVLNNLRLLFLGAASSLLLRESPNLSVTRESAGRMPYALAIAVGTMVYLVLLHQGWMAG